MQKLFSPLAFPSFHLDSLFRLLIFFCLFRRVTIYKCPQARRGLRRKTKKFSPLCLSSPQKQPQNKNRLSFFLFSKKVSLSVASLSLLQVQCRGHSSEGRRGGAKRKQMRNLENSPPQPPSKQKTRRIKPFDLRQREKNKKRRSLIYSLFSRAPPPGGSRSCSRP